MASRGLGAVALLAGLASFSAGAAAQEFEIVETPSVTQLPIAQLKPRTIVFSDQPGDELVDPAVGFIRYEDWAKARPIQQQFLSLYPGYAEPNVDIIVDGTRRRYREKLHMYVAEARFVICRGRRRRSSSRSSRRFRSSSGSIPAIKHQLATAADQARPREARVIHNQHPQRKWCEGREVVICLRSTYKLEGRLPVGIQLANKIREGSRRISDTLEFDSELTVLSAAEVGELGLAKLTAARYAAGRRARAEHLLRQPGDAVRQALGGVPGASERSRARPWSASSRRSRSSSNLLGKQKQFANVPVLRNLVPAQVLSGKSSFNSGKSLSAGLPVYARNQIRAIAAILEAGGQAAGKPAVNPVR